METTKKQIEGENKQLIEDHVVKQKDDNNSSTPLNKKVSDIFCIVLEIKRHQNEETEWHKLESTTRDSHMKMLAENNSKMAAEIESLKAIVEDLRKENNLMKVILDIKQEEWVTVEKKDKNCSTSFKLQCKYKKSFFSLTC